MGSHARVGCPRCIAMLEKFKKIFNGLEERFGYHIIKDQTNSIKKSGESKTSHYPHTDEMWQAHLDGKKFQVNTKYGDIMADSLGMCPINKDSKCKWGAIDLDNYRPDIQELFKKLKSINVPVVPIRSKSGGVHVYVFLKEPVAALLMREKLHSIKHIFGVEKPDRIFPVQKYLDLDKGSAGSWINLPYYNYKNTERYMIKEDGSKASIEEFFKAYEKSVITPSQLKKMQCSLNEEDFKDGPPCLQTLASFGIERGARDEVLLDMTRYLKMRFPENWQNKTGEYNTKFFKPELTYKEVQKTVNSRENKDYPYRCNQDHLSKFCNKGECILKKFGVKSIKGLQHAALGPLSYIKSTPRQWFLGFDGEEVKLTSKELTNQQLAREAATEQTGKTPPRMKQVDWDAAIAELQERATGEDAPEESMPMFKLKESLKIFCFESRRTEDRTRIDRIPFYDKKEKNVHFVFDSFYSYITETKKWKHAEHTTHTYLKNIDGLTRGKLHIQGNIKRNVYTLSEDRFGKEDFKHEKISFGNEKEVM